MNVLPALAEYLNINAPDYFWRFRLRDTHLNRDGFIEGRPASDITSIKFIVIQYDNRLIVGPQRVRPTQRYTDEMVDICDPQFQTKLLQIIQNAC